MDARQEIDDLPDCEWYVLDRNTNIGFVEYGFAAERMQAIANVFPAFFFLVAALVCLTTMTRMVDEQRNNMGVCKALGYGKGTIAAKYLFYALSASLLGSLLGVIIGMQFSRRSSLTHTIPSTMCPRCIRRCMPIWQA